MNKYINLENRMCIEKNRPEGNPTPPAPEEEKLKQSDEWFEDYNEKCNLRKIKEK